MLHVPRREELALFHIDRGTGRRGGEEQVRLPAQESRNLQHVDHFGGRRALFREMYIAQHRTAERVLYGFEDPQPLFHTHAPRRVRRGAVGLVIG